MTRVWQWLEGLLERVAAQGTGCDCAGDGGCDCDEKMPGPTIGVKRSAYQLHRQRRSSGDTVWSPWSWRGRMVLDAEHWRPRPMPTSPLSLRDWSTLQESASADHVNLLGRHYLTMPLTYDAGPSLAQVYGRNLVGGPMHVPTYPAGALTGPTTGLLTAR